MRIAEAGLSRLHFQKGITPKLDPEALVKVKAAGELGSVGETIVAHPGFRGDENGRRDGEGGRCVEMTPPGLLSRSAIA